MLYILFNTLSFGLFLLCAIVAILHFYWHIHVLQWRVLQQLDADDWSLVAARSSHIYRVRLKKIINHYFYIVLVLESAQHRRMVIWFDQLSQPQWKNLQVLAKLF